MSVNITEFGKTKDGTKISAYEISNSKGMKATVMDFGAILTSLFVPDGEGKAEDIVLGYDSPEPYFINDSFFGATVGPNANRIGNASFTLHGVTYHLDVNDGPNNLHSHGDLGYHKRMWKAETSDMSVTFSLEDEDGSMGFPGNKKVKVTYEVTEENELKISYDVTSDKDTVINMTNHSYFNLAGHASGKITEHTLWLNASHYTPVVDGAIPTGEIADVKGTVFDFTEPHTIGERINENEEQLILVKGYDHNWVLDQADGTLRKIAEVTSPDTDRVMEVYTDLPGVQFYAGNCIMPTTGKGGVRYGARDGLCLETQYYPDTANKPEFPSAVFGPDRPYRTTTVYKFRT